MIEGDNKYLMLEEVDMEKFRREESEREGKHLSNLEAMKRWIKFGRPEEFHAYAGEKDPEEIDRLIEENYELIASFEAG